MDAIWTAETVLRDSELLKHPVQREGRRERRGGKERGRKKEKEEERGRREEVSF